MRGTQFSQIDRLFNSITEGSNGGWWNALTFSDCDSSWTFPDVFVVVSQIFSETEVRYLKASEVWQDWHSKNLSYLTPLSALKAMLLFISIQCLSWVMIWEQKKKLNHFLRGSMVLLFTSFRRVEFRKASWSIPLSFAKLNTERHSTSQLCSCQLLFLRVIGFICLEYHLKLAKIIGAELSFLWQCSKWCNQWCHLFTELKIISIHIL